MNVSVTVCYTLSHRFDLIFPLCFTYFYLRGEKGLIDRIVHWKYLFCKLVVVHIILPFYLSQLIVFHYVNGSHDIGQVYSLQIVSIKLEMPFRNTLFYEETFSFWFIFLSTFYLSSADSKYHFCSKTDDVLHIHVYWLTKFQVIKTLWH